MAEHPRQHLIIHIPTASILKVVGVLLAVWLVYLVRDVVVIVFIAMLLSTAFEPVVNALQRRHLPRVLSIIVIYLGIFLLLSLVVVTLVPLIADEIKNIAVHFPQYWSKLMSGWGGVGTQYNETISSALQSLQQNFSSAAGDIFVLIRTLFGSLISFIIVMVLTFYLLVHENALERTLQIFTPPAYQAYVTDLVSRMQQRLAQWLRGVLLLGLIVGGLTLVGLRILDVRYYLVLALVAGIFEIVPYVGPVLATIPAVFFATTQSPWKGLAVLILYWLVQQLENHLIVPKVMSKALGVNPLVVIVAVLLGAKLAGFAGILVAVPTTAALSVWVKDLYDSRPWNETPPREPGGRSIS